MPNKHKHSPVTFRPPEGDRAWLYQHAAHLGRSVGSVLSEALAAYRAAHDRAESLRKEQGREFNFGGGWRPSPGAAFDAAEKSGALSEAGAGDS